MGQIPMVCREPPYPFRSLSASDEVGARPSLPNFVRKGEYLYKHFEQCSPKPLKKIPLGSYQQGL